jgi:rfaE bifunctional protein kinase chain/domain
MSFFGNVFNDFNDLNVMVIGDVMVDSYLWGKVDRISPEAPVPIVNVVNREQRLGGAANVALNLMALGASPHLVSVIGKDPEGDILIDLLARESFSPDGIYMSKARPTTIKHRVIGGSQQLLRVDSEDTKLLDQAEKAEIKKRIEDFLPQCQAVIFEDYDKGVIDPEVIEFTVQKCRTLNIPVAVDPKKRNFLFYKGVTLFKPNLKEIREGLNIDVQASNARSLKDASEKLRSVLQHELTLLTLSEYGIYYDGKHEDVIPAHRREIADVSGAGDTVISIAACCMALGLPESLIAELSNLGGGLVCEHVGVVPIEKDTLLKEEMDSIDPSKHGLDR